MKEKQQEYLQMENAISIRLLKMLLCHKAINQPTHDKVVDIYKKKEAV